MAAEVEKAIRANAGLIADQILQGEPEDESDGDAGDMEASA
jgi:hypothetical protein